MWILLLVALTPILRIGNSDNFDLLFKAANILQNIFEVSLIE